MRIKLNSKFTLIQTLLLVFLFLASANVFAKYFYFIFIAFVMVLINSKGKIRVDISLLLLVLFSLLYILFDADSRNNIMNAMKHLAYPMCYFMGLNFLRKNDLKAVKSAQAEKQVSTLISVIAMGAFFHYLLNFIINIDSLTRNNTDIWSGETLNATGQAALSIMAISVFITTLFFAKSSIKRLVSIVGVVIVFLYNFILAGRSLIIISAIVLVETIVFYILGVEAKHKTKKILIIISFFVLILMIYIWDVFGFRKFILGSNLSTRLEGLTFFEDVRLLRKYYYFGEMLRYPFGGGKIHDVVGGYAHDLLLDTYSEVGIFPFILLLVFLIVCIMKIYTFTFKSSVNYQLKVLVLCMYTTLFLEFFIEPIFAGMPWMFCAFCVYQGVINNYLKFGNRHSEIG